MDEGRTHSLTDESLDRELAAAIDVEPSPEFLARVRMRLANEPAPSSWRTWWIPIAASIAVAAIAVAIAMPERSPQRLESREIPGPTEPAALDRDVADPAGPLRGMRPTRTETLPPPDRTAGLERPPDGGSAVDGPPADAAVRAQTDSFAAPFPDVLISEDEQRAFALLLSAIRADELPALPAPDETVETLRPKPLEIAPLVIEPLPLMARLE